MASKRESVAGCIRRLRNKLKAAGNGMVTIGYADLMVSLDAVETAHVTEIKELKEILDGNNRVHDAVRKSDADRRFELQGELVKKDETIAKLKNGLERAINIICGKCYDKVRAKCARGEKKDCEVFELRKALEGDSAKLQKSTDGRGDCGSSCLCGMEAQSFERNEEVSAIKYESLGDMLKDGKCHNALSELAERLASNEVRIVEGDEFPIHLSKNAILDFRKARLIIAELAKIEKPIDKSEVKPSIDGRVHFADILKADEERAFEVLRNCRSIAEEE